MSDRTELQLISVLDIIVSVPGAFSPQCSDQVPGYIENADKFAEKGVRGIYVVAVNDSFTVQAWKEKLGGGKAPQLHFLADDEGKVRRLHPPWPTSLVHHPIPQ